MAAGKTQNSGLSDFFRRWRNGDLLERHRRYKVANFWDRLLPLIDPDGNRDEPFENDYTESIRKQASAYIHQRITPEQFDRMVQAELERHQRVSDADLAMAIEEMRRPALFFNKTPTPDTAGAFGCFLGGLPNLPPEIDWPWCRDRGKDVVPMHFVAQIDVSQLPRDASFPQMPKTGTLFFFLTKAVYHFMHNAETLCSVIYVAQDVSKVPPRKMPQMPDFSSFDQAEDWAHYFEGVNKGPLKRWNFDFLPFDDTHVPARGNVRIWKACINAACEANDRLREISTARVKTATANDDADGTYAPLHQMFGCQSGGNAGGETLFLHVETDADLLFEDQYIQGLQIHFASTEARDAFDLSKVRLEVESS